MKSFALFVLHLYGVILAYIALGVAWYWFFKSYVPFPKQLQDSIFLIFGVYFILPVLGVMYVRVRYFNYCKILGFVYIVLWAIALLRFLDIILTK